MRSLVGLLPLCATVVVSNETVHRLHAFRSQVAWIREHRPELAEQMAHIATPGEHGLYMFSALDERMLRRVLAYVLDENEFRNLWYPLHLQTASGRAICVHSGAA